jgi:alkanesulfonate monooxygenase SsuD/methylene tetrahydromethanopterin reductase-like flavin-dependent oxidoreductase (luciferase family)
MRLGYFNMPLHPPGSDPGRGVGSGGFPGDFQLFGIDAQAGEHREVTRAALDLILDLWNDPKPGGHRARHWRFFIPEPDADIGLRLRLRPYQRPHPPIAVAGVSARSETLVLAGPAGKRSPARWPATGRATSFRCSGRSGISICSRWIRRCRTRR